MVLGQKARQGVDGEALGLTRRRFIAGLGVAGITLACAPCLSACADTANAAASDGGGSGTDASGATTDPDREGRISTTMFYFDTVVQITVFGAQEVLDACSVACDRYDRLFSAYREESDVWNINHAQGEPVTVDPDTADLIVKALEVCEASDGRFDITIGAVSLLWDFEEGIKPDDAAIVEALAHVDWRGVDVDGNIVQLKDPQAALDLGGIAKGWIADSLAALIASYGVTSAIINLGGNVYALGSKPSGAAWTVGIRDPNVSDGPAVAQIEVCDRSVVTSGLYERHFEVDGVDYHHILDPKTGYPVKSDMRADTVVSARSTVGDGLSTTLFIYGVEQATQTVEDLPEVEALFVDTDGAFLFTSGFDTYNYQEL